MPHLTEDDAMQILALTVTDQIIHDPLTRQHLMRQILTHPLRIKQQTM
jgi:hypothetical protein